MRLCLGRNNSDRVAQRLSYLLSLSWKVAGQRQSYRLSSIDAIAVSGFEYTIFRWETGVPAQQLSNSHIIDNSPAITCIQISHISDIAAKCILICWATSNSTGSSRLQGGSGNGSRRILSWSWFSERVACYFHWMDLVSGDIPDSLYTVWSIGPQVRTSRVYLRIKEVEVAQGYRIFHRDSRAVLVFHNLNKN